MDANVQDLLAAHDPYLVVNAVGKVECTLNGHAMPAKAEAILPFVKYVCL